MSKSGTRLIGKSGLQWMAGVFCALAVSTAYAADEGNVDENFSEESMEWEVLDPEVGGEWPENTNGDLPMAGIFYGNSATGVGVSNAGIGVASSRRFRVERTGQISTVRFQNRVLTRGNIKSRCAQEGKGSTWCNCQDAGLDEYTCGYTLGSSYHVGNGGTIVIELRPDDGTGLPSSAVLGKTGTFVPMDNQDVAFPRLDFINPVDVEIGGLYHLVFTNLNPPTSCSLASVPVHEASRCPRNQGAIGLNGVRYINTPTTTGLRGPYRGNTASANFYKRSANNSWREYENNLSFYEVGYTDGVTVGESYSAIEAMNIAKRVISGNDVVRQVFTVEDSPRNVDGVWLNFGQTRSASGASLAVTLKDTYGSVIANGTIESSEHCRARVNDRSIAQSGWCQDWGYTSFETPVFLEEFASYSIELKSESGGGFIVSAYEPLNYHGFKDRNHWDNARAEYSNNGGSDWNRWTADRSEERDLPLLFTIEGMPRQLH